MCVVMKEIGRRYSVMLVVVLQSGSRMIMNSVEVKNNMVVNSVVAVKGASQGV